MQCEACIDFINANAYGDCGNANGLGKVAPSSDDMFASDRGCRRRTWIEGPPPPLVDESDATCSTSETSAEDVDSLFDDMGELWAATAEAVVAENGNGNDEATPSHAQRQRTQQLQHKEWMETGIGCRLTTVITSPEGYAKIITRTSTEVSHDIVRVPTLLRPVGAPNDITFYEHNATESSFLASALKGARKAAPRKSSTASPPSPGSPSSPRPSVARVGTGSEAELRTRLIARNLARGIQGFEAPRQVGTGTGVSWSPPSTSRRLSLEQRKGRVGGGFSPVSSPKSRKRSLLLERRPVAMAAVAAAATRAASISSASAAAATATTTNDNDNNKYSKKHSSTKRSYLSLALNLDETDGANSKQRYLSAKHRVLFESQAPRRRQRKPRRQRAFTDSDLEMENEERQIQAPLKFTAVPPLAQTEAAVPGELQVGKKSEDEKRKAHGRSSGFAALDPGFVFMRQRKWAPPVTGGDETNGGSAPPREVDEDSAAFRRALAVLDRTPYAFSTHRIAILYVPEGGNSSEREVLSNRNG